MCSPVHSLFMHLMKKHRAAVADHSDIYIYTYYIIIFSLQKRCSAAATLLLLCDAMQHKKSNVSPFPWWSNGCYPPLVALRSGEASRVHEKIGEALTDDHADVCTGKRIITARWTGGSK